MIARAAALALLSAAAIAGEAGGILREDTTWSGTIELVEDVLVDRGVKLTIEPGTRIVPAADVKGTGPGWSDDSLEIHVRGAVLARGTPTQRILFGPAAPPEGSAEEEPTDPTWAGLVFLPGRAETSRLSWCAIDRAHYGVQVGGRDLVIERCLFSRCRVGVAAGILRSVDGRERADRGESDAPILRRCLFAQCDTGLSTERKARPDLERCVFLDCRDGVGYARYGRYFGPVDGVGTRLERCEFIRCKSGVASGARITNAIFDRNEVAIRSSRSHALHGISIDRYRIECVLAEANDRLLDGDLPAITRLVKAPVGRKGELPTWRRYRPHDVWGPPLETALALRDDSAGRGAALDGGDLGAFGRGRQGAGAASPGKQPVRGVALDSWLMCGPIGTEGALDKDWPGKSPRRGQRGADFVWIGVADATSRPRRPGGSLTHGKPVARYAVAGIDSEKDQTVRLGIEFSGRLRVWCGGRPVLPETKLDFAKEHFVEFDVEKGSQPLMFRIEPEFEGAPFRARVTDKHGDPPRGITCESQQSGEVRFRVRVTRVTPDDRGGFRVELRYSSPPHWADATDPSHYSLETLRGVVQKLRLTRIEYEPRHSTVALVGLRPPYLATFRITVAPIRDTAGVRQAPDCRRAEAKFK